MAWRASDGTGNGETLECVLLPYSLCNREPYQGSPLSSFHDRYLSVTSASANTCVTTHKSAGLWGQGSRLGELDCLCDLQLHVHQPSLPSRLSTQIPSHKLHRFVHSVRLSEIRPDGASTVVTRRRHSRRLRCGYECTFGDNIFHRQALQVRLLVFTKPPPLIPQFDASTARLHPRLGAILNSGGATA